MTLMTVLATIMALMTDPFQNDRTKLYLSSVKEADESMPLGPLFLNPSSVWSAAVSQVITKVGWVIAFVLW